MADDPAPRDGWLLPILEALLPPTELARLRREARASYWDAAVGGGCVDGDALLHAVASRFKLPIARDCGAGREAPSVVPEALARRYGVVPIGGTAATLDVATCDP